MPVDIELPQPDDKPKDPALERLNTLVALSVALLATFMGICSIKAGNVGQAMQAAQADKIDYWGWYQARNIREEIMTATAASLEAQSASGSQPNPALVKASKEYRKLAEEQAQKKAELQEKAEGFQKQYDAMNERDDQFDMSDAGISIAIALLALTSLTGRRFLFYVAMVPACAGILFGLAGLLGWAWVNAGPVARWLGA